MLDNFVNGLIYDKVQALKDEHVKEGDYHFGVFCLRIDTMISAYQTMGGQFGRWLYRHGPKRLRRGADTVAIREFNRALRET